MKSSSIFCFKKTIQVQVPSILSFPNRKKLCNQCKWFISNPNQNEMNSGFCKKFKKFNINIELNNIYEYAIDCRNNDFQCGKNAYYFEPNEDEKDMNNKIIVEDNDEDNDEDIIMLQNQIKEMEELNCGEVNEKRDLDNWEKEYFSIKKRIEKLLKLRIKE